MRKRLLPDFSPLVEVITAFTRRYSTLNCQLLAAGISFYALLSLIPLLLFGVAVLGYFLQSSDQAVAWITSVLTEYFPSVSDPGRYIVDALARRPDALVTGGFGLLMLMWSGLRLFETSERALTTIWTGGEQRSFLKRQLVSFLTMWAAGIVVLVSVGASLLLAFIRQSSALRELLSPASWLLLWRALGLAPSFMIVGGATFLLYWVVPKANVPWKAALVGAIPATVMWEALRQGFATFVSLYSRRWEIYGGLASAVLLTFWIYCSTTVVLFGAVIARVYQERTVGKPARIPPVESTESASDASGAHGETIDTG